MKAYEAITKNSIFWTHNGDGQFSTSAQRTQIEIVSTKIRLDHRSSVSSMSYDAIKVTTKQLFFGIVDIQFLSVLSFYFVYFGSASLGADWIWTSWIPLGSLGGTDRNWVDGTQHFLRVPLPPAAWPSLAQPDPARLIKDHAVISETSERPLSSGVSNTGPEAGLV